MSDRHFVGTSLIAGIHGLGNVKYISCHGFLSEIVFQPQVADTFFVVHLNHLFNMRFDNGLHTYYNTKFVICK